MKLGPSDDRDEQRDDAGDEDSDHLAGVHSRERLGDALEPGRARALHEHAVAGVDDGSGHVDCRRRIGTPVVGPVAARELADADHDVDAEILRRECRSRSW